MKIQRTFVIGNQFKQIFTIKDLTEFDVEWLHDLTNHIEESEITDDRVVINDTDVYIGVMDIHEFRTFLIDTGYDQEVTSVDAALV
jgi:hypothetical protein